MQMPTMQQSQPPKVKPGEKLEAWLQRAVPALVSGFGKSQDVATQLATQAWMQVNQAQPDAQQSDGWGNDSEDDGFGDSGSFGGFGKSMWSDDEEDQGFEWDDPQDEWGQPVSDIANGAEPEIDSTINGNPAEWFQKRLGEYARLLSAQLVDEEEISEGQRTMIDAASEMLIELLGEQVDKLKNKPVDENDASLEKKTPKPEKKPQSEMDNEGDGMDAEADPFAEDDTPAEDGTESDNPFADKKKKKPNPFASSKAATLISLFESEIHLNFTNLADSLRRDGHLTRHERITFSNAIGDALGAFVRTLEGTLPAGTLYRSPWDNVGEDTPQSISAPTVIIPDATATKGGDGSGNFGHAGRPGERGGSAPSGSNEGSLSIEARATLDVLRGKSGTDRPFVSGPSTSILGNSIGLSTSTSTITLARSYKELVDAGLITESPSINRMSVYRLPGSSETKPDTTVVNQGSHIKFSGGLNKVNDGEWQWYNTSPDGQNAYLRKLGKNGAPLAPGPKTMVNIDVATLKQAVSLGTAAVTVGAAFKKSASGWMDDEEEDAAEGEAPDTEADAMAGGEEDTDPEMAADEAEDAAEGEAPDDSAEDTAAGGEEDDAEGMDDGKGKPAAKALGGPASELDGAVKSLGKNRIGGYLMMWGNAQNRDLEGEYFTPNTEEMTVIFDSMKALPVIWHHAQDGVMKSTVIGVIDTMKPDEIGMWVEAQIKNGKAYRQYVQPLLKQGMLGWSSGALPGSKKAFGGEIKRWATVEGSLTPTPMDHRQVEVPIDEIKAYFLDAGLKWDDRLIA